MIVFSDLHISLQNEKEVLDIINQIINICKEKKISIAAILGDVYESRKSQPLLCLKTFEKILDIFKDNDIELIGEPGNHDKISYQSEDSYLDQVKHWPGFILIRNYDFFDIIEGIRYHFIPYFDEEITYLNYLNQVKLLNENNTMFQNSEKGYKNYLFTHIGIDGVLNNDGENVNNPVKKELFKDFDQVFIGHFHNYTNINKNIHYIGSVMPINFGEDNNKGCVLLNDDGTFEHIVLSFKRYEKIVIDVDKFTKEEENRLLQKYSNHKDNIRFEFTGDSSKVKSLDKAKFEIVGIDVVTKNKEVEETVNVAQHDEVVVYDNKMILEQEFPEFCEKNELENIEIGEKYLKEQLDEK